MKKILLITLLFSIVGNAQFRDLVKKAGTKVSQNQKVGNIKNSSEISAGLKEALNNGITKQVSKLTAVDGFYKNEAVKILMPQDLQKVDRTLRSTGMGKLADQGIVVLNRAAEDAVKEATPIFVNAIKTMSISDAKSILLGSDNAATVYLQNMTSKELYSKFSPVVQKSIGKVGADEIWSTIITKYNSVPLVGKVNPDITDYVTTKALEGVFKMISIEEKDIRGNLSSRTSTLLKTVFAMQDKK